MTMLMIDGDAENGLSKIPAEAVPGITLKAIDDGAISCPLDELLWAVIDSERVIATRLTYAEAQAIIEGSDEHGATIVTAEAANAYALKLGRMARDRASLELAMIAGDF